MTTEYDRLVEEQATGYPVDVDESNAEVEDVDVDTGFDPEDDEVEVIPDAPTESDGEPKAAATKKEPKKPARGDLPEGYVTPVGLAKIITEKGLHGTEEDGSNRVCPPQVVYSYIKNAPKEHPFPLETVKDSVGQPRQALKADAGVSWWEEKNKRVAERKQNAADKAAKAAARAAAKPSEAEAAGTEDAAPAEEAE